MKQIKNLLLTTIILITFSACQDKFGEQSFVIVVEAENENDAYKIEYVKRYVNGKERQTAQIDTLGKIFYDHININHTSIGQNLEYLPITIKRVNGNGRITFSIIEFNRFKSLTFDDLPENLKKNGNTLSWEDLNWVYENAAYRVFLQPTEDEKEILVNSTL